MKLAPVAFGVFFMAVSPGLAFAAGNSTSAGLIIPVQATGMTDAQVQQKLQSEGYTNVQVTNHDKSHIDVTATKNGKTEKLAVNPQTGAAMPDEDKD